MPGFSGLHPMHLLLLSSNTCGMSSISSSETQHARFLLGLVMWHLCLAWMKTLASQREYRFQHSHSVYTNGLGPGKHSSYVVGGNPLEVHIPRDSQGPALWEAWRWLPSLVTYLQPLSGNVRFDWWSRTCLVSSCSSCFHLATNKPSLGAPYGTGSTLLLIQCSHWDAIPTGGSSWASFYQRLQTALLQMYQPVLYSRREPA